MSGHQFYGPKDRQKFLRNWVKNSKNCFCFGGGEDRVCVNAETISRHYFWSKTSSDLNIDRFWAPTWAQDVVWLDELEWRLATRRHSISSQSIIAFYALNYAFIQKGWHHFQLNFRVKHFKYKMSENNWTALTSWNWAWTNTRLLNIRVI